MSKSLTFGNNSFSGLDFDEIDPPDIFTPQDIKEQLDEHVIGQDSTKKILSILGHNNILRTRRMRDGWSSSSLIKSNVLIIGGTGCGKTFLVQTLSKILNTPVAIVDITAFTQSGYVGRDIRDIISELMTSAYTLMNSRGDYYFENTQDQTKELLLRVSNGIVFIDEFDKIKSTLGSLDVRGRGVQEELLKMIEGNIVNVKDPYDYGVRHKIDTKDMVFIFGGAFTGLDEIVSKRTNTASSMGFSGSVKSTAPIPRHLILKQMRQADIIEFGFIGELIGRISCFTVLDDMNVTTLQAILLNSKSSVLGRYKQLFEQYGCKLSFDWYAIELIAKAAYSLKLGARSLQIVVEKVLEEYQFSIPSRNPYKNTDLLIVGIDIEDQIKEEFPDVEL